MAMLGLQDTVDKLARADGVCWYGHGLRKDKGDVLRRASDFKVNGRRGRKTWRHPEEDIRKIGLSQEHALDRGKVEERTGMNWKEISLIWPSPFWGLYRIWNEDY